MHTLLHTVYNYIVASSIYGDADKKTVTKFLKESNENKNKIIISRGLDKNYSSIISN